MLAQRYWIPAQEETLVQQPRTRRVLLPSMHTPRSLLAGTPAGWGKPGEGPQHTLGVTPECHQGSTTIYSLSPLLLRKGSSHPPSSAAAMLLGRLGC